LEAWQRYHCGSVELSRQSHAMSNGNVALERWWGVDDLERCGSVDDLERGGIDDKDTDRTTFLCLAIKRPAGENTVVVLYN